MVCHCSVPGGCLKPDAGVVDPANAPGLAAPLHAAKAMTPPKRRQLALEALAGAETLSRLAGQHAVSRKFVYTARGRK